MYPVDEIFSNVSIGEKRLTWRELAERQQNEIRRLSIFATIVSDLDRNEHGRHEGDVDGSDPTGVSQGNPYIPTGAVFGFALRGDRKYVMPPREQRPDPNAWAV